MSAARRGAPYAHEVFADPSASRWLKQALRDALERDPVDAANDAELLADILDAECRILLGEGSR